MKLKLQIQPISGAAFEFQHAGPVVRIGRDPGADLALDSAQDNVSWEHARITLTDKAATLTDLASTNGTYLNGSTNRIKSCALKVGDELQLGQTGPRLAVLALQLANHSTVAPPEPRRPKNGVAVAPASVSATRKLLIQTQSRHRNTLAVLSSVFLLLLLLVSTVIWLLNRQVDKTHSRIDETNQSIDAVKERQDVADQKLDQIVADVRGVAGRMEDINKQQKADREQERGRVDQAVNAAVREAARFNNEMQAELRRLQEQGRQPDAKKMPLGDLNALNRARGGDIVNDGTPPLKFTPGLVLSIRKKDSANKRQFDFENAALVYANPEAMFIHWFDNQTKEIKMDDVETITVKNQMYQFNPQSKRFESAVAFFRLDRTTTQFSRLPYIEDDLASYQRGCIVGESPNFCLVHRTGEGLVIAVPKKVFGSLSIPAKSIQEIVTNFGVFTWSETERDYVFQTHQQIADKLNADREQKMKEYREDWWKKRKEAYQLVTDRLNATQRHWGGWW